MPELLKLEFIKVCRNNRVAEQPRMNRLLSAIGLVSFRMWMLWPLVIRVLLHFRCVELKHARPLMCCICVMCSTCVCNKLVCSICVCNKLFIGCVATLFLWHTLQEIGFTHMRVVEGIVSQLQLDGLLARMCQAASSRANIG